MNTLQKPASSDQTLALYSLNQNSVTPSSFKFSYQFKNGTELFGTFSGELAPGAAVVRNITNLVVSWTGASEFSYIRFETPADRQSVWQMDGAWAVSDGFFAMATDAEGNTFSMLLNRWVASASAKCQSPGSTPEVYTVTDELLLGQFETIVVSSARR